MQNKAIYFIETRENSLLYQVVCYIRALYIEFWLYYVITWFKQYV